jgi:hypothetical protein
VTGDTSIGYDEKGEELVRVPLHEPIYVRTGYDEALETHRSNIT